MTEINKTEKGGHRRQRSQDSIASHAMLFRIDHTIETMTEKTKRTKVIPDKENRDYIKKNLQ